MSRSRSPRFLPVFAVLPLLILSGTPKGRSVQTAGEKNPVRVVACDAAVPSRKRGICANELKPADFPALARGVTWWYNWHFQPTTGADPSGKVEFLPMAWGDRPEDLAGLEAYLKTGARPRRVLAINEPNLKDQAFISPETTAKLYRRVKNVADRYGVPVCGPQMSLGSPTEGSITAYDPVERKATTYTFMVPFLKAVLAYTGDTPVPETAFHAYGDIHELRWALDTMHREFGRPVWVTEFNHVPDPKAALIYLMQSVDLMERTAYVPGYAWFKERTSDAKWPIALLGERPGTLTPLGEAYVAMPVHEADLYYRVPGRLQAERYVAMEGLEITPTTDTDGFADMATTVADATLDANVQIDRGGRFALDLRTSGAAGTIEVFAGGRRLGYVANPGGAWNNARVLVTLPTGPQRLRFRFAQKGQAINWIGFTKG